MNRICIFTVITMAIVARIGGAMADGPNDEHTTVVQNGNDTSVITQSGDPGQADVSIERSPGQTIVHSHSGGNTATVRQGSDPFELPPELKELFDSLRSR